MLRSQARRLFYLVTGLACLALGLYLALRPTPYFSTVSWLPQSLSTRADHYGRFRNLPAFGLLACLFLPACRSRRSQLFTLGLLGLLAAAIEAAQIFIPGRTADLWDIFWSWTGLLLAGSSFSLIRRLAGRRPPTNPPPIPVKRI